MKTLNKIISKLFKQKEKGTSAKKIRKLLRQVEGDSKRVSDQARIELLKIVRVEGKIKKELCTHSDFAVLDGDVYEVCSLCGRVLDV